MSMTRQPASSRAVFKGVLAYGAGGSIISIPIHLYKIASSASNVTQSVTETSDM